VSQAVFSSWNDKILDTRQEGNSITAEEIGLSLAYDHREVQALISWNGLVVADASINVVTLAGAYMREVAKLSCGECSTGYNSTRLISEALERLVNGQGRAGDIALIQDLATGVRQNAKCDFCAQAVKPILDSLSAYAAEFKAANESHPAFTQLDYITKVSAPCMEACPIHQDIPGYVELVRNRRYNEALEVIQQTNCLPGITGRACVAFCESNCVRGNIDQPISIRALKRVPADVGISKPVQPPKNGKKDRVGVIGAGPAGLAAARQLALMGYRVTVFDERPAAGGMMDAGIPAYRLPRRIIEAETAPLKALGVEFKFNTRVKFLEDMTYQYKATIVASGAHLSKDGGIANWNKDLDGLMEGVKFLNQVNSGQALPARARVLVVGGGNTAIDCARAALRQGSKEVTIIYRRSRTEMPAHAEEIEAAEKEGVKLLFLALPVKIMAENNKVSGAECQRMELGEPDSSGRRRPVPVKGSEFIVPADLVLTAIGESPELSFLTESKVELTSWGSIKTDEDGRTNIRWLFAAGDCASGPASIVEAMSAGKRAALSVDRYLAKSKTPESESQIIDRLLHETALSQKRSGTRPAPAARRHPRTLLVEDRLAGFDEVEKCFDMKTAAAEADRCLRCYRVIVMVRK